MIEQTKVYCSDELVGVRASQRWDGSDKDRRVPVRQHSGFMLAVPTLFFCEGCGQQLPWLIGSAVDREERGRV